MAWSPMQESRRATLIAELESLNAQRDELVACLAKLCVPLDQCGMGSEWVAHSLIERADEFVNVLRAFKSEAA